MVVLKGRYLTASDSRLGICLAVLVKMERGGRYAFNNLTKGKE